jgi:hypothetical protein
MLFWVGGTFATSLRRQPESNFAFSAFVGLVTMLLLFPIPGYVAGVIQKVQVTRMKKVPNLC